jgi:hypothetical protein
VNSILNTVCLDTLKMPAQNIQVLIDSYGERQKTGVLEVIYASEKSLYLFFRRGDIINTYLLLPHGCQPLPSERIREWIRSAGAAYVKVIPLSSFGVLIFKLLIQSFANGRAAPFSSPAELDLQLGRAVRESQPSLALVTWDSAVGCILFAPSCDPKFIFVSQDIILDEVGSYKVFSEWHENDGTLTVFNPAFSVQAWQEYYLRRAFADLFERILSRFEVMTGRVLVDSLLRLVAVFASRQNLDIVITARSVTDREVFSSPESAAASYRLLLSEVFEHFSAVIGPRLYASISREVVADLPEWEREAVQNFSLLPKGHFYE